MRKVKPEVFTDDEEQNLSQKCLTVWDQFRVKRPRKLPIIDPSVKCKAQKVDYYAVESCSFDPIYDGFAVL